MRRPQMEVFFEDLRVTREKLAHNLGVCFFTLGVPHLLVAAQAEHVDGFRGFSVAPQDASVVGKRGRRSVVRVLGAHHFGY